MDAVRTIPWKLFQSITYHISSKIIFIRNSNEIPVEELSKKKSEVIPKDDIPEEMKVFYNYTCQKEDCVRSFAFSSHNNLEKNLTIEKEFLNLL